MAEVNPAEISAILKQQLSGMASGADLQEVGTVLEVGDGIGKSSWITSKGAESADSQPFASITDAL